MLRGRVYARFSSNNQREESIEGQLRECHHYAKAHNIAITGEYCDRALSGRTDKRPEFLRMIREAERGQFDVLLVYKVDRFARNRYDSAMYKAKLKKAGVKIVSVMENIPETPEGIILESVMEGFAEYYSANLAQNVSRGLMENALKCKIVGGQMPLGYRKSAEGKYEIDPANVTIVQEIFARYADGETARSICDYLNAHGVRTSRGGEFGRSSLVKLLQNRKYIGEYAYHELVVPDGVPRIIDQDTFERVQRRVAFNVRIKGGKAKAKEEYLLTSKVFCGYCGEPLVGESGRGCNDVTYHYYKCYKRKRTAGACRKQTEHKEWLENVVVQETITHALTDENIASIADMAIALLQREASDRSILESLQNQLQSVETALANVMRAIEMGVINSTTQNRMQELERIRDDLSEKIAREADAKPMLTRGEIVYWLESFRTGDPSDPAYRRRVIDTLVAKVVVYDEDDGGRKLVILYNMTKNNTSTVSLSDIEEITRLKSGTLVSGFFVTSGILPYWCKKHTFLFPFAG